MKKDDELLMIGLCFLSMHEEVPLDELLICASEQGVIWQRTGGVWRHDNEKKPYSTRIINSMVLVMPTYTGKGEEMTELQLARLISHTRIILEILLTIKQKEYPNIPSLANDYHDVQTHDHIRLEKEWNVHGNQ